MTEQEEALYDLCTELHHTKSVSVVEVVALRGYYALLAMVMNAARTPLPEGRTPPLPLFPR